MSEARAAYDRLARDGNGAGSVASAAGAGAPTTVGRTEEAGEDEPQADAAFDRVA